MDWDTKIRKKNRVKKIGANISYTRNPQTCTGDVAIPRRKDSRCRRC